MGDSRVSWPMVNPLSAMVRPLKKIDLHKIDQFYINKDISHITTAKLQSAEVPTNWPEEKSKITSKFR